MINPRAIKASYKSPNTLIISFQNGEQKSFDFTRYLIYPAYRALQDENLSKKVQVKNGIICWNDEIDFDPDLIYLESASL